MRFVIAKIEVEEEYFFIVNIYAPNDYRDQDNFINTLSEYIISKTNTSRVIIAGDWNLTLNRIDKQGGQPWKTTTCRNAVFDLMDEFNLTDIYRQLHKNQILYLRVKNLKVKIKN